ncbi:nitroreductase family deazaflavin-dependent oxidoreductase [Streptomyces bambusae]|uniref:Nitroreductase family deazaflavin-dependent oxidoreductase n=1 Tax=Streptomyces bambusae TaxID=1550616 RepID=A0ABS6ZG97_9ACTN|nr:nitroreductase family deazaflavin-dependent oxidoreductase [Streptomyces bambusae]MBW5486243.1 nitroreductase family deazaflavin-dependent oxidoreductase [Streptomyces bambusae]
MHPTDRDRATDLDHDALRPSATDWDHPADPHPGWQRDHVTTYAATAGTDGHIWHGVPTLLLTTAGRVTGRAYRTALIYGEDEGVYITAASGGSSADHPDWYRNLLACPEVRLQIGADVFAAKGRPATADERDTYWGIMTGLWPAYEDEQERTEREIPLVLFERAQ